MKKMGIVMTNKTPKEPEKDLRKVEKHSEFVIRCINCHRFSESVFWSLPFLKRFWNCPLCHLAHFEVYEFDKKTCAFDKLIAKVS